MYDLKKVVKQKKKSDEILRPSRVSLYSVLEYFYIKGDILSV